MNWFKVENQKMDEDMPQATSTKQSGDVEEGVPQQNPNLDEEKPQKVPSQEETLQQQAPSLAEMPQQVAQAGDPRDDSLHQDAIGNSSTLLRGTWNDSNEVSSTEFRTADTVAL